MVTARESTSKSVLSELRAATDEARADLEAKLALQRDHLTSDRYAVFLRACLTVVEPLETRIACWLGVPTDGACRATALRADLHALGASEAAPASVLSVDSLAAAMGAAFVIEGSLFDAFASSVAAPLPRRFLSLTATRWRVLSSRLESWGAHASEHARLTACESARATYGAFALAFAFAT